MLRVSRWRSCVSGRELFSLGPRATQGCAGVGFDAPVITMAKLLFSWLLALSFPSLEVECLAVV
jgi:hypothetical protein